MASPTFPIRLDSTETQVNVPNPVIPRSPVQPGFSIRFNQNLIDQMSAPFPYVISLAQITQSGASVNQVPVWNGSQWVPITLVGGGINSLNGLTALVQSFATGTAGTDFGISSVGTVHTFNIPDASSVNRGLLTSTDWTTFNSKQNALTFGNVTGAAALNITGGTGAVIGGGVNIGFGGTNLQYVRGDGSLAIFPTVLPTTWGSIWGVLSNQTDLQSALNAKFDNPTGTILQYIRGNGSLATFPTSLPPSGAAGGDLSGTYPNPSVVWANGNTTYDARYFRNGGNAFGATGVLGTTDANILNIITNNATRISINSLGEIGVGGAITSNIRMGVWGIGTSSSSTSFAVNNSTSRIFTVRDDGEVIVGPIGFGGSIRPVNSAGNIDLVNGQVLGFRSRTTAPSATIPSFYFNTAAQVGTNGDGIGLLGIEANYSNASFNRQYYLFRIFGTVNNNNQIVNGILINPTVTNADFVAINTASGRHIFTGAQDWNIRNITGNRTLDGTDMIVNVNATSGNITITLPTLTSGIARVYCIKRTDTSSNTVTIAGTIDGGVNYILYGSLSVWLEWDNAASTWRTF